MQTIDIIPLFKEKGIKATAQRIAVYNYLAEHPVHPDVDTVYQNVVKENPSFSKTTVYNCLQALDKCGLIIPIKIDADKIRYDADTSFHGHFICDKCKKIYDFRCGSCDFDGIDNFSITRKDVYFSGVCDCCKID